MTHTSFLKPFILSLCLFTAIFTKAQPIEVDVNENVELMSILSRMAGFPEYNMDLAGQYITEMDNYFQNHRSHPAIAHMQQLRRENGISYDAVMDMAIRLRQESGKFRIVEEEQDLLDTRWQKVDKQAFLEQLGKFYRDTDFHTFFTKQAPIYQKGIQTYKEIVMKRFDQAWYGKFYGKEAKEKFGVIIGFCNGGGNYNTDLYPAGGSKEIYAVVGYHVDKAGAPQYNGNHLLTLIHEFNHSFVNYLLDIEENRQGMEQPGNALLATSYWAMNNQAYGNWMIMVNESLVRAAVVCYLLDGGYGPKAARAEMSQQLQRNFRWIPGLVQTLRTYENNRTLYPTLESFYPQIIQFFKEYAEKEQKEMEMIQ